MRIFFFEFLILPIQATLIGCMAIEGVFSFLQIGINQWWISNGELGFGASLTMPDKSLATRLRRSVSGKAYSAMISTLDRWLILPFLRWCRTLASIFLWIYSQRLSWFSKSLRKREFNRSFIWEESRALGNLVDGAVVWDMMLMMDFEAWISSSCCFNTLYRIIDSWVVLCGQARTLTLTNLNSRRSHSIVKAARRARLQRK